MKKTLVSMLTLVALFGSLCLNAQTTAIKPPRPAANHERKGPFAASSH